jgi:hypothetical protein
VSKRLERLEAELTAMRPRGVPAELTECIESHIAQSSRRSWSDRLLILSMSAGGVAAAVIVGVVLVETLGAARLESPAPADLAVIVHQHRGEMPLAFARADDARWP